MLIAVSASGFTKGAVKKAEAQGIILRTVHTLSEQEIRDWGRVTNVEIIYYEFTDTNNYVQNSGECQHPPFINQ
jgi:hypothetical protein